MTVTLSFRRSSLSRRQRFVFKRHRLDISTEIVSAHGDIDATNADAFTEYAAADVTHRGAMILDMRGVGFMGIQGFSALHRISVNCAAAQTRWVIVPSVAVSRVLALCDPEGLLSCAGTMQAAQTSIRAT
jgi:anti-anti-sigma factor